jgi:RHH-type proline utilization regulon transcriptional repressor/proline dehydrogenase/delta 1-pyrroline-5-carboxylate dehydrogenase
MAHTFIAGATVAEAAPRLTDLWQHGRAWSVDLLGEATISDREADRYRDRCMDAMATLAREAVVWPSRPLLEHDHLGPIPRVQLSIKISTLSPHLDPIDPEGSYHSVAARLRLILDLAMRLPISLIFDMEQADTKTLLVEIFTRLFLEPAYKDYPYAGLALQAYHRETARDIEGLLIWVRRRGCPLPFAW